MRDPIRVPRRDSSIVCRRRDPGVAWLKSSCLSGTTAKNPKAGQVWRHEVSGYGEICPSSPAMKELSGREGEGHESLRSKRGDLNSICICKTTGLGGTRCANAGLQGPLKCSNSSHLLQSSSHNCLPTPLLRWGRGLNGSGGRVVT